MSSFPSPRPFTFWTSGILGPQPPRLLSLGTAARPISHTFSGVEYVWPPIFYRNAPPSIPFSWRLVNRPTPPSLWHIMTYNAILSRGISTAVSGRCIFAWRLTWWGAGWGAQNCSNTLGWRDSSNFKWCSGAEFCSAEADCAWPPRACTPVCKELALTRATNPCGGQSLSDYLCWLEMITFSLLTLGEN